MAGSVYLIALVAVVLIVVLGVASPIFLVPIVVLGLGLLALPALLALLRHTGVDSSRAEGSDVPSTREASYDPVGDPAERST